MNKCSKIEEMMLEENMVWKNHKPEWINDFGSLEQAYIVFNKYFFPLVQEVFCDLCEKNPRCPNYAEYRMRRAQQEEAILEQTKENFYQ